MASRSTNTMSEVLESIVTLLGTAKMMPDADIVWLTDLETQVIEKARAPFAQQGAMAQGPPHAGVDAGAGQARHHVEQHTIEPDTPGHPFRPCNGHHGRGRLVHPHPARFACGAQQRGQALVRGSGAHGLHLRERELHRLGPLRKPEGGEAVA